MTIETMNLTSTGVGYIGHFQKIDDTNYINVAAVRGEYGNTVKTKYTKYRVSIKDPAVLTTLTRYADAINQRERNVFIEFTICNVHPTAFVPTFGAQSGKPIAMLGGELTCIKSIRVDGKVSDSETSTTPLGQSLAQVLPKELNWAKPLAGVIITLSAYHFLGFLGLPWWVQIPLALFIMSGFCNPSNAETITPQQPDATSPWHSTPKKIPT